MPAGVTIASCLSGFPTLLFSAPRAQGQTDSGIHPVYVQLYEYRLQQAHATHYSVIDRAGNVTNYSFDSWRG